MKLDSIQLYELIKKRLPCTIKKFGLDYLQISDDLVHDVYLSIGEKQTIEQACLDALRKRFGRTGTQRYYDNQNTTSITDITHEPSFTEHLYHTGISQEDRIDCSRIETSLVGNRRIAWILYFNYGFHLKEIGHVIGLTESRISQILQDQETKVQSRISKELLQTKQGKNSSKRISKIQGSVSHRSGVQKKSVASSSIMGSTQKQGMAQGAFKEVQEELCRTFRVNTF